MKWTSKRQFGIFFKISDALMRRTKITGFQSKYEHQWDQAVYKPTGAASSVARLKVLLVKALEARTE